MSKDGRWTSRIRYGEQAACAVCDQDIEWHGKEHGWIDRGGNRECVAFIKKGDIIQPLKGSKHKPQRVNV